MSKKRVIAVFTGNRAEYGLQHPILKAIDAHPDLEYRLLVSGAHLDPNFGNSVDEIKRDGFDIHATVNIQMGQSEQIATAQAIGSGVIEISRVLDKIKPDFVVVYADRFEGFSAVIAATQMNIPTVHVEGGDLTEGGALDDSVRHAMTKLSHLHMTTNQEAAQRILLMGEEPWRVHVVGLPTLDLIQAGDYASETDILRDLCIDPEKPILVFTQHSVTTEYKQAKEQVQKSLKAIEHFLGKNIQCIMTYPNNDVGSAEIVKELDDFLRVHGSSYVGLSLHRSLGRIRYHGLLALAKNKNVRIACVGNSSSGVKETGLFGCPTLNIGSRQNGRLRSENVLDCSNDTDEIISGINKCLFNEDFRNLCMKTDTPYGIGDAGLKIAKCLAEINIDHRLLLKKMTIKTA